MGTSCPPPSKQAGALTRVDANEGEGANEGVGHDLEGQGAERSVILGGAGHGHLRIILVYTLQVPVRVQDHGQLVSSDLMQNSATRGNASLP